MRISNDGFPVSEVTGEEFVPDGKELHTFAQAVALCRAAEKQRLKVLGCTMAEALRRMRQGVKADLQREQFGWRCIDGQWFDNEEHALEHGITLAAEQRELRRLCPAITKAA